MSKTVLCISIHTLGIRYCTCGLMLNQFLHFKLSPSFTFSNVKRECALEIHLLLIHTNNTFMATKMCYFLLTESSIRDTVGNFYCEESESSEVI